MVLAELGLVGTGFAAAIGSRDGVGFGANDLVTPASAMKVQVALTVENAIAEGRLDGQARRSISPADRTVGPTGISLMRDEVSMSLRDLVVAMLTVSDNVATDELIDVVGIDRINDTTRTVGLAQTRIVSNLRDMLDAAARDAGFTSYTTLAAHNPATDGSPTEAEIRQRLAASATLNPARGTRTTAAESVALLQAIWSNQAGSPQACAAVRYGMERQLTRHRIAAGFGRDVRVAAKSGALMGIVRNEVGVVTFPDGAAYAVAIFTRVREGIARDQSHIDTAIGRVARALVDQLRT